MTVDYIVVGAGVIGSSIAYHLAKSGAGVELLDDRPSSYPSASWASAGGLRRQNRDPREWPLTLAGWKRWPLLEDELGADCQVRTGGHLHIAEDEIALGRLADRCERERAAGLEPVLLSATGVHDAAPILHSGAIGGILTGDDGQANPRLTTDAFRQAAVTWGALFRKAHVSGFVRRAGDVTGVLADGRQIKAHDVVLAAGSWTPALVSQLGIRVPIRARAFQMLLTDECDPILAPTLAAEERPISLKQLPSGAFYIGGGWPAELDRQTCRVLPESIAGSWRTACELVPLLRTRRVVSSHCGIESESLDGVPLIGRLPQMGGLYIACGFSGHGFQLAPAIGAAVAAELNGHDAPELMNLSATRPFEVSPSDADAFVSRSSRLKQS